MTDHFGPTDRVADTLTTLRADTDRLALPDSGSVRRRGEQRTRHQVVAGALAAVVLAAGAIGLMGGVGGDERRTAPPAESPTPTAEATRAIAADPFFADGDVELYSEPVKRSPESPDEQPKPLRCMPRPAELGAEETRGAILYTDLDPTFSEHVLRFATAEQAAAAAAGLRDAFAACPEGDPAEVTTEDRLPAPLSETSFHASRLSTPTANAGIGYYELGVAREANVLVVLQLNAMGNPAGEGVDDWVWTADRLQLALDRAVATG